MGSGGSELRRIDDKLCNAVHFGPRAGTFEPRLLPAAGKAFELPGDVRFDVREPLAAHLGLQHLDGIVPCHCREAGHDLAIEPALKEGPPDAVVDHPLAVFGGGEGELERGGKAGRKHRQEEQERLAARYVCDEVDAHQVPVGCDLSWLCRRRGNRKAQAPCVVGRQGEEERDGKGVGLATVAH